MGGFKYPHLSECRNKKQSCIFAEYVASKENPADKESRINEVNRGYD